MVPKEFRVARVGRRKRDEIRQMRYVPLKPVGLFLK